MNADLARKRVELRRKAAGLKADFAHWRVQTSATGPLPRHHSQVERMTRQLEPSVASVSSWLDELDDDDARLLDEGSQVEGLILDLYRIWEFVRSKLAQRYVDVYQGYLAIADELAWECYRCARERADPALVPAERIKEPPLVYLNGGYSPFAMSRGVAFEAEWVPDEDISRPQLNTVLDNLPVPIIGVPWYQVGFLPDLVALGHEVGHAVENDFRLTDGLLDRLDQAAARLPDERRACWRRWTGELFADLYGTLAMGPAFVSGLMDFLAQDTSEEGWAAQTDQSWSPHPPHDLRVSFNVASLELLKLDAEAQALRSTWSARVAAPAMAHFAADVDVVLKSLCNGPYAEFGGRRLVDVITFGVAETTQAEAARLALEKGLAVSGSIRSIVAGFRRGFEHIPTTFYDQAVDEAVADAVRTKQRGQVRGHPSELVGLAASDAESGRALFAQMKQQRVRRPA